MVFTNRSIFLLTIILFSMHLHGQKNAVSYYGDSLRKRTSSQLLSYAPLPTDTNFLKPGDDTSKVFTHKSIQPESAGLKVQYLKIKKDTLKVTQNKTTLTKKDSTEKNLPAKRTKVIAPKGTISLGYEYGFLPYAVNMPSPASAFKTEGRIEMDAFNLPVDLTFFYSSQKNLIGLNNYFRLSYNAERYKEKLNTKLGTKIESYKTNLTDLTSQKQNLLQKMAYADYLSSISPDKWPVEALHVKKPALPDLEDSLSMPDTSGIINKYNPIKNNIYSSKADSISRQAVLYKHKADSVIKLYDAYKNKYDVLSDSIKRVETKIGELENFVNGSHSYKKISPYLTKVQNFLSGVKKTDVGLCYPNYSTFLSYNVPVRGINFEYEKNNYFFALTYGTTVSTLLYNTKSIDGVLQSTRNAYNYFDITNLSAGRKILSAKFGVGEKEGNHFFVGFLLGRGYSTYSTASSVDLSSRSIERNLVLEADVCRKISKNTTLDITLGKSSLQQQDVSLAAIQSAATEIFSGFRSYAALIKLKTSIAATKTNVTFSVRWVDPFFNSFGIGFIRSDNMRYEVKLDQPLTKSLRYTAMARYEEDNLLKLLNYKNTFYSINNTVSYKIKRGLMLRAGYTPLIRTLNGEGYHSINKNAIITGILTYMPKLRTTQMQFNLSYNYYHVNTDSTPVNFQNFSYYHQFTFKSGFKTGLNVSWFKNNLNDTSGNTIFLGVLDFGYQFKNGSSITAAGKSAYKIHDKFYPGFLVKSTLKLSKASFWENQVEKFIVGDLFNGYDLQSLKRFPYNYSTKLILNF